MAEQDLQNTASLQDSVGMRLRLAREAKGLTRADIAARTKIAERHLAAIEEERYADLASSTYAVGFSRAYARTVGLDEAEIAQAVRRSLEARNQREVRMPVTFEPGDPARVPGSRIAWLAGIVAALLIGGFFLLVGRSYFAPAVSLPDLAADVAAPSIAASTDASPPPPVAIAAQQPVVFTATRDRVWVKFYDAAGTQLLQRELAMGESYTVPADANGPMIRTVRPDALRVTIGGQVVAPLADRQMRVQDVPVSAAALLARGRPAMSPAPAAGSVRGASAVTVPAGQASQSAAVISAAASPMAAAPGEPEPQASTVSQ
jgi:transcriptional regulator with XRE-family HTH domain